MDSKNYLIHSHNDFFVKILALFSRNEQTKISNICILLGGIKKGCILININPFLKIGNFSHLEYNEKCSINGRLKRGHGTIDMLNSIFSLIKNNYFPNQIETLIFEDDSYIFNDNGKKIWLYLAYYLIHGKTWYESKFSSVPSTDNENQFYQKNRKILESPINIDWNTFSSFLPFKINDIQNIKSKFDIEIEKNGSWQKLIDSLGQDFIFNVVGDKLPMLFIFQLNLYFPKYWKIDLNTYISTKYTITEIYDNYLDNIQIL